ncbi:hypothetical protein Q4601_19780 [Shewanella sp. 1_MG-2023]|uniref:Uncharacterized protein n=1 Tax=Shewanella electrodiphila TaxID=934143 RepID=A0ABT0KMI2_9GAMM|nr:MULTISPECIES: hypothetical protein [Shewanella]MCL1044919.1 hypothetical protein [Shewanella electrodiphila]MDO6613731.1 hypothetical protein [Shewanella sp. 7_MG-2023]MDO6772661.1 hypothetical protein [Shewanella sp. 2_MG-2023]MDO6796535.1 hypothetical protein [Shewanella sp. 1_MG-2023]
MISILSLFLGFALIGLAFTVFGILLSLLMGLFGFSTKRLNFNDSFDAAFESMWPAIITSLILVIPGCVTFLRPTSDIPDFLIYENRFGQNDDIKSGFILFMYIFTIVFLILYIMKIKEKLK